MRRPKEPAIPDHAPADVTLERLAPLHAGGRPAEPGRFAAGAARRREQLDGFIRNARPWALRQARRSYGHLPTQLQQRAVERALLVVRAGVQPHAERRALYALLAEALTTTLRQVHTEWCLDEATSVWGSPATPANGRPAPQDAVATFVEDGLGGLERAVLQLEIGAGRDSAAARAALRLAPREYRRHREQGLAKLRGAVAGLLSGRVCQDHLDTVTLAATGDRTADAELNAGPGRCRACAREAAGVRGLLRRRLALAPWPLAIKPAGLLGAKVGAAGAVLAGKGGSVAVLATTALVAAGGTALVGDTGNPASQDRRTETVTAPAVAAEPTVERRVRDSAGRPASRRRDPDGRPAARTTPRPAHRPAREAPPAASAPPAMASTPAAGPVRRTVDETIDTVAKALEPVREAVRDTTAELPPLEDAPVSVDGTVDELLKLP